MDRKIIKIGFTRNAVPEWACPTCDAGFLQLKANSLFSAETRHSRDHSDEDWDPDWICYVYSCLFQCSNHKCKEIVASSGLGCVDSRMGQDENEECQELHEDYFKPKHFEPALKLIRLPESCPPGVKSLVEDSFALFLQSPSAAANCVRASVEQLLTELKVEKFDPGNNERRISLHHRIALLPDQYSDVRDLILAIKWLGNAGSHGQDSLTADDVLDAYELLEHVLDEIYVQKAKRMKALAKKINQKIDR